MAVLLSVVACVEPRSGETEAGRLARLRVEMLEDSAQDARLRLKQFLLQLPDSGMGSQVAKQYYNNGGKWLWVSGDTSLMLHHADSLAHYIQRQTAGMGFLPAAFLTPQVLADIDHFRQMDFDSAGVSPTATMAQLELNLTRAYLQYAQGQRYGFVRPHDTFNCLDPRDDGGFRIVYDIDTEKADSNFGTDALAQAAKGRALDFVAACEPTSSLYHRLRAQLAKDSTAEGRQRIMSNMERARWRHKSSPEDCRRHVFVNIPSQQLWAVGSDSVFSMRICCGAWATKTPLLISRIGLIQLNPEWNIPMSILKNDVSSHAGDSAYFARNRYFIIKRSTGDTISPKSLTADQLKSGAYRVAQHSGPRNSLGRLIFRFPNQFDVYLHDTNNHGAFGNERRTISHGCVRVQHPFSLAMFLLPDADEWTLDKMRISIDRKPEGEKGREYVKSHADDETPARLLSSVNVSPSVPLFIDYYTLYPNPETGEWETWPDRYEYDKQILERLRHLMP